MRYIMTNKDKILIDPDCLKFFVSPPKSSNLNDIFMEAVRRAYGDMSRHTLHFNCQEYIGDSKNAQANREQLRIRIVELIKDWQNKLFDITDQESFDVFHNQCCENIISIFTTEDANGLIPIRATPQNADKAERKATFSYGQAQKVFNMIWKYVYLFYNYFNALSCEDYADELKNYQTIIKYLHTPIDSFVIDAATNKKNDYYLGCKPTDIPWSQFYYDEYISLQKDIRNELNKKNLSPFIWELKNFPFN